MNLGHKIYLDKKTPPLDFASRLVCSDPLYSNENRFKRFKLIQDMIFSTQRTKFEEPFPER